jgi:integrase
MASKARKKQKGYSVQYVEGGTSRVFVSTGKRNERGRYDQVTDTFFAASETDAHKEAEAFRDLVKGGYDISLRKQTVEEYVGKHLLTQMELEDIKPQTYYDYSKKMEAYVYPRIGHIKLQKLTTIDIDRLYYALRTEPLKKNGGTLGSSSIRHCHSVLHQAFDYAVRDRAMDLNPTHNAKLPKRGKSKSKHMSEPELAKLLDIVDSLEDRALAMAISIAIHTGLRRGEILGLQWGDIDFSDCDGLSSLTVNRALKRMPGQGKNDYGTPKSDSSGRCIELTAMLHHQLLEWKETQRECMESLGVKFENDETPDDFPIITNEAGTVMQLNHLWKKYNHLMIEHDFEVRKFHELRHTHASYGIGSGMTIIEMRDRLGHASGELLMSTYGKTIETRSVQGAMRINEAFQKVKEQANELSA